MGWGEGRRISRQMALGGSDHAPDVLGDVNFFGIFRQFGKP